LPSTLKTLERKPIEPDSLRLGSILIQISKVPRTPIELKNPIRNIQVRQRALGTIGESDELRRCAEDVAVVVNRFAAEEIRDAARDAVSEHAGFCVRTGLVVENADRDLRNRRGRWDRENAGRHVATGRLRHSGRRRDACDVSTGDESRSWLRGGGRARRDLLE
jgi:hypothetical protein